MAVDDFDKLKETFHTELLRLIERTKSETSYNPKEFSKMVSMHGGFEAAKRLLRPPIFPFHDGLAKLSDLGRLDLSLEECVIHSPWCNLFSDAELELASRRIGKKFIRGSQ
jgi:hypothetical protein